ncbi:hypothetical protein ACWCQL_27855 [Streptomyces sp. NPDC002073]|uniref:hypothetical protein n=1 Tax=Streptomyces sp. NBC_00239 TaxID=2903640 RepID=UPI002E2DDEB7|nr:hypothetical protein [Streptomyces sp. NBC_00239]
MKGPQLLCQGCSCRLFTVRTSHDAEPVGEWEVDHEHAGRCPLNALLPLTGRAVHIGDLAYAGTVLGDSGA